MALLAVEGIELGVEAEEFLSGLYESYEAAKESESTLSFG